MNSKEPTTHSIQFHHLKVRCPQCNKLYSVDERQIRVLRPQFECMQCHSLFYFDYLSIHPEEEIPAFLVHDALDALSQVGVDRSQKVTETDRQGLLRGEAKTDKEGGDATKTGDQSQWSSDPLEKIRFTYDRHRALEFIEDTPVKETSGTQEISGANEPMLRREPDKSPRVLPKAPTVIEFEEIGSSFCPRCDAPYRLGEKECARCGIVFAKFSSQSQDLIDGKVPHQLVDLWQKVLVDFASIQRHEQFLEGCIERGHLPFAARKYKVLQEANPADDLVRDMLKRISVLSSVGATVVKTERVELWKVRLFGFVVALGLMFIVVGFSFEGLRNLVGLGATLTFLAIGIRLVFS